MRNAKDVNVCPCEADVHLRAKIVSKSRAQAHSRAHKMQHPQYSSNSQDPESVAMHQIRRSRHEWCCALTNLLRLHTLLNRPMLHHMNTCATSLTLYAHMTCDCERWQGMSREGCNLTWSPLQHRRAHCCHPAAVGTRWHDTRKEHTERMAFALRVSQTVSPCESRAVLLACWLACMDSAGPLAIAACNLSPHV